MRQLILCCFALVFVCQGAIAKKIFKIDDPGRRDTVRFVLDAPLETINGITNHVTGSVYIDDKRKMSGSFSVPVSSLKTGIEKRDKHLQNKKWLNASRWPNIKFRFEPFNIKDRLYQGKKIEKKVKGWFSIHGKEKKVAVKLTLQYLPQSAFTKNRLPGNLLRIKAETQVKLHDFGVARSDSKIKALVGLKVGEVAEVSVDMMATDTQ